MKDDSLNDTQNTCGFCSGPLPCLTHSVGKRLRIVNIDKALDTNVYERQIWNEAIDAAAELFPYGEWEEINIAAKIRKLKK